MNHGTGVAVFMCARRAMINQSIKRIICFIVHYRNSEVEVLYVKKKDSYGNANVRNCFLCNCDNLTVFVMFPFSISIKNKARAALQSFPHISTAL